MSGYPAHITPVDHIEAAPRRVRAMLAGEVVLDTRRALYVWETPSYPQYYVPLADVDGRFLLDEQRDERLKRGSARRHGVQVGDVLRAGAAHVYGDDALAGLAGTVRFQWDAFDAWFEEDEEVFVHPRSPYVRVDALRAAVPVRVELEGVVLAESSDPVLLFETGLPTRYYLPPTALEFSNLLPSDTVTSCPYKGRTGGYWSARTNGQLHDDVAWTYTFPTREVLPIAGLVAFYNERVDLIVDGRTAERPATHFS